MSNLNKSKVEEMPCRSCTSFSEYMKQSKKRYLSDLTKQEVRLNSLPKNSKNSLLIIVLDHKYFGGIKDKRIVYKT